MNYLLGLKEIDLGLIDGGLAYAIPSIENLAIIDYPHYIALVAKDDRELWFDIGNRMDLKPSYISTNTFLRSNDVDEKKKFVSDIVKSIMSENKLISELSKAVIEAYIKGYRLSDCGKVVKYRGNVVKQHSRTTKGKTYLRFSVRYNKQRVNINTHRLVAFQNFGYQLFGKGILVRHFNDVSTDNSKENIAIGTRLDNANDAKRNSKTQ